MQKAVEFSHNGVTLRGMMHVPDINNKLVPIVPIYHGFTGNKMEANFMFVKLSRALEKRGIASVRFDFGGSGESDGEFVDMTVSGEVEEAQAILDFAISQDFVDKKNVAVAGESLGAAIAGMVASKRKDDIKTLCMWAPAANIKDVAVDCMKTQKQKAEDFKKNGFTDIGGFCLGYSFWEDVKNMDIYDLSKDFDKDVLICHGDADTTVPYHTSDKYLQMYGSRSKRHTVKGADHVFSRNDFQSDVISYTVEFLADELL